MSGDADYLEDFTDHDLIEALEVSHRRSKLTQEHYVRLEELVREWKKTVVEGLK